MDDKIALAPPTTVCLLCSSVEPLTPTEDDTDRGTVLYFTKKGLVTRRKVCLYCQECEAKYSYTDYGNVKRGYRLYATPRDAAGLIGSCAVERTLIHPLLFDDRADREKSWTGFARAYNAAYSLTRDKALTTDVLQAAILEAELERYYREAGRLQLRYKSLEDEIDQLLGVNSSTEFRRAPSTPDTVRSDGTKIKYSDQGSDGSLLAVGPAETETKEGGRPLRNGLTGNRLPIGPDGFHCHAIRPENPEEENRKAFRKLLIATCLSLFFVVMELIGGYLAGSLVVQTDAAHVLADVASFLLSLASIRLSSRARTKRMTYGWLRVQVVGSLTSIIIVWIVTGVLVYCATMRLVRGSYHIHGNIMLITAVIGVIVNTILGYVLHEQAHEGHGHGHGHSHTHGGDPEFPDSFHNPDDIWQRIRVFFGFSSNTFKAPSKSILVRAAFIHVLGDFLQSLGVLLAACIIYVRPAWKAIDPICTYVFSILVLITTISVMRDLLIAIMQGFPRELDFGEVAETLGKVNGVVQVHDLHVWILCDHHFVLTSHIVKDPSADSQEILRDATSQVNLEFDIQHVTLQIEDFQPIMKTCENCRLPAK
ncbi:SLC30A3 [Branchiostoma lanceolatum]|uniref:SLC30A3 protein n=1 Tax=Branchiostoma lanceolatum TaxID=7740 RepID=A0A8J9WFT7_BRALA|nr:SLC30A3 [Branchiostoma lanceolatum]